MRRWMTVLGCCAAGAALGAAGPWLWYGGRMPGDWDYLALEVAGPPGLWATILWAFLGLGAGLVFGLELPDPKRRKRPRD